MRNTPGSGFHLRLVMEFEYCGLCQETVGAFERVPRTTMDTATRVVPLILVGGAPLTALKGQGARTTRLELAHLITLFLGHSLSNNLLFFQVLVTKEVGPCSDDVPDLYTMESICPKPNLVGPVRGQFYLLNCSIRVYRCKTAFRRLRQLEELPVLICLTQHRAARTE